MPNTSTNKQKLVRDKITVADTFPKFPALKRSSTLEGASFPAAKRLQDKKRKK